MKFWIVIMRIYFWYGCVKKVNWGQNINEKKGRSWGKLILWVQIFVLQILFLESVSQSVSLN